MFDERFQEWDERSRAIDAFRLLAILCMVFTHVRFEISENTQAIANIWQSYAGILTLSFTDNFMIFIKYGIARVATPALAFISAWFLLMTIEKKSFLKIAKSKSQNLLIPYFFWNFILFFMVFGIFIVMGRDPMGFGENSMLYLVYERIFDFSTSPVNFPLYYLWDLFLITVAYTLIHPFVKNRSKLFLAFALLWPVLFYSNETIRSFISGPSTYFPRTDLIFYFFIGIATFKYMDVLFDKKVIGVITHPVFLIVMAIFVFLFSHLMYFSSEISDIHPPVLSFYLKTLGKGVACIFVFAIALKIFLKFQYAPNRKMIFRIFCTHAIWIYFINIVVLKIFGTQDTLTIYFGTYIITICCGIAAHYMLEWIQKKTNIQVLRYI